MVAVPADWIRTRGVVSLDPARPIELGAIVEPLHTVLNGQDQVRVGAGDSVLVLGLGPIGILHVASAIAAGATPVLGVDPDSRRVAAARTILGADHAAVMHQGWQSTARARVGDGGFDVVIVAAGSRPAIATAIELTDSGGRVLAFAGLPAADRTFELDLNVLHYRQIAIVGAFGGTPTTFRRAAAWLATNDFDIETFAPDRFPLVDALEAFASAARGQGIKTLLRVD